MTATKRPRRSASLIEAGDTFVFNGLVGEDPVPIGERVIEVVGVDILGNLRVYENTLTYSLPYDLALRLIEERIWQECEQP